VQNDLTYSFHLRLDVEAESYEDAERKLGEALDAMDDVPASIYVVPEDRADLRAENERLRSIADVQGAEVDRLRGELSTRSGQLQGAAHLSDTERERVLWWLHKPVPPGPMKELDEQIIRKFNGGQ
jgi:hypothetical protein